MKVFKIIIAIFLIVAVIGGIVAITNYLDNNLTSGTVSVLTNNGEPIPDRLSATSDDYRIDVEGGVFSVKIIANEQASFNFTHNDVYTSFPQSDVNWNEVFDVQVYDDYFTFDNGSHSFLKLFEVLYPDETVKAVSTIDKNVAYFTLEVGIGEEVYKVLLVDWQATVITLDKTEIYF